MQRVELIDPDNNESPNDICWHNIKMADKYLNLEYFIPSINSLIELNPTKNLQDIEKMLRDNNLNTHLIAKKPNLKSIPNAKLRSYVDNVECTYECVYSCKPKEFALKEVLQTHPSYEENYENLLKAGRIVIENPDDINKCDSEIKIVNDGQKELFEQIKSNKKKLQITMISSEKYLSELHEFCETTYKKKPEEKIIGTTQNGGIIFGLFVDKKLISDTGFTITTTDEGQHIMSLVDLRSLRN